MQEEQTGARTLQRDEKTQCVRNKEKTVMQEHSDQDEIRRVSKGRENYSMVVSLFDTNISLAFFKFLYWEYS